MRIDRAGPAQKIDYVIEVLFAQIELGHLMPDRSSRAAVL